jgi:DNA uptake protein ComE-like DNA-binding protein
MRSKIHYYLRFIFGLTQSEIKGFSFLFLLLFFAFGIQQFRAFQSEKEMKLLFKPQYYEAKLDSLKLKKQVYEHQYARKFKSNNYSKPKYQFTGQAFPAFRSQKTFSKSAQLPIKNFDINSADSLLWISLPGIGPGFAKRIMAYREKLGGFYSVQQLKEVYGLDSLWVNSHSKNLHIGQGVYRKLSLQKTEWKEFRHPYLPYAQAKIFLNYRRQHPEIHTFQALDQILLLDKQVWAKLRPYLTFDE